MKYFFFLSITIFSFSIASLAQSPTSNTTDITTESSVSFVNSPYFVISTIDKDQITQVFRTYQNQDETSKFDWLEPESIESINILKGEKAKEKYGKLMAGGVIEIRIKEGHFENLPSEIQEKFIPEENLTHPY
ncbi:hypothetical protein JYB64_10600 [Algoriphagus aestuarii]|nr:hypothetical protein [Algoriphagus aestuarii]